jgi:hypothetical protein
MTTSRRLLSALLLIATASHAQGTRPLATVSFVGCPADGQVGPLDPPKGIARRFPIPESVAAQLAYYQAEQGRGVLGPRGWFCFETYGSNGGSLFLTPKPIDGNWFFDEHRSHLSGPAIQYSSSEGGTSGRFEVARIAARVFPQFRPFVKKVIAEGLEPASNFHFAPYPADKLTYKSDHLVEFVTPGNSVGLGAQSWLARGPGDITGFAWIGGEDTDLLRLNMRLPPALASLGPFIIKQAEHEAAQPQP